MKALWGRTCPPSTGSWSMIDLQHDGISMRMTLEELGPYVERLDRDALIRLVMKLSAQVHYLQGLTPETKPTDPI